MLNAYHQPVLLNTCIENLITNPNGVYVDLTFGGGGHSKEILKHLSTTGKLFAFDQDVDAQKNILDDERLVFIPQNFRYLKNYLRINGVTSVDGILGDLGVSSHQFDEAERGFSIRFNAPLDMRMNKNNSLSAQTIVNEFELEQLITIFKNYAELPNSSKVAKALVEARNLKKIESTDDLKNALQHCSPKFEQNKFFARVFQALRIVVNDEIAALEDCLNQCVEILKPNGRLVFISYHSLEDRLVKNLIRSGNTKGEEKIDIIFGTTKKIFKNLTSKPIIPSEEEIKNNTRARSAKLRIAEKI